MPARLAVVAALLLGSLPGSPATAGDGAWVTTLPASSAFDNLSAFPDGTVYSTAGTVVVNDGRLLPDPVPKQRGDTAGYFKSTDFGVSWTPVAPPPGITTATTNLWMRFATPKVGYATFGFGYALPAGSVNRTVCKQLSSTFRTADGGLTWQPLCEPHLANGSPVGTGASPLAVAPDGRTVLLTATQPAGTDAEHDCPVGRGVVYTSLDAGEKWSAGLLPKQWEPSWVVRAYDRRSALVLAYHMEPEADCSLWGRRTALFVTHDSGRTWRKTYQCASICASAAFVTRSRIVVGANDGSTAYTNDGGRTWRAGQRLFDVANEEAQRVDPQRRYWHWVQGLDFADANIGYASTRGAGTWRTVDGGRTWTQERSHECVYYPWGVGENAAATTERAVTGGPGLISARVPSAAPAGPCTPRQDQLPAVPAVVAQAGPHAVLPDATLTRR